MIKVLFLIHDLGQGGAEKVLVNLVNNMDTTKFNITVMSLFDYGVNKQFLRKEIEYKYCFKQIIRGNSHLMKILPPKTLHKLLIKEKYDIEISYLEGPCARIISGCSNKNTKLISWIHIEQHTKKRFSASFRSYKEACDCYNRFNKIICVSETVKKDFASLFNSCIPLEVLYNTNESDKIKKFSLEDVENNLFKDNEIKVVGVGKLLSSKGFDRIIRITKKLLNFGFPVHTYILGIGPEEKELKKLAIKLGISEKVTLLGYQVNPYKYISKCDLFVCASYAEGFSTAATEALIVGTPVCTVEVSGMKEMLGENNEYGIVTKNDDEALFQSLKNLCNDPKLIAYYKKQAIERGKNFSKKKTVKAVEDMLMKL